MRIPTLNTAVAATLLVCGVALAQTPKAEQDHSAHHPAGNPPATAAPAPKVAGTPTPDAIDRQMKAMQEMHQKMQAAQTPAESAKLMDDHMKLMQSGMAMMEQMRRGPDGMVAMGGSVPGGMGTMPQGAQGSAGQPSAVNPGGMSNMGGMMGMHMNMERRMAMMEQMMQMMVDREAARTGK